MTTDKRLVEAIFAGDSSASASFYCQCMDLFRAYFLKHFPAIKLKLQTDNNYINDLYNEATVELLTKIHKGSLKKEDLTVDLSSYLIGIGKNKYMEDGRRSKKDDTYRIFSWLGPPKRKPNTQKEDAKENGSGRSTYSIQSETQQKELDTRINTFAYKPTKDVTHDLTPQEILARKKRVREEVNNMGEPCRRLILYTWKKNYSDEQILERFDGLFPSTNAIKMKRYRCHQTLKEKLQQWHDELQWQTERYEELIDECSDEQPDDYEEELNVLNEQIDEHERESSDF